MKIKRWLFDILASLIILFSCIVGFMGVFFLSFFLTRTTLHPFFIWLIFLIGVYFVFYIHYKVTKYLELFEKKAIRNGDFSDTGDLISKIMKYIELEWNPKAHPFQWTYKGKVCCA